MGGATGAVGGASGSGVPALGRGGKPKGGGGVPIGTGGGAIAGISEAGVLGSGGIPTEVGGGGRVDADPGKGGNSVLVLSPGNGGRPPLFPARSGTGGIPGIALGSTTGEPLLSSAEISLISLPGTGTRFIFPGIMTGTMASADVALFFESKAATTVSEAISPGFAAGSMYFLIITAESSPTKDAVTTNPALVSRFIEPTPYKLSCKCRQNRPCTLIMSDKFHICVYGDALNIRAVQPLTPYNPYN